MNPKLSIIVPIYNSEKYLEKCIDSILKQEFQEFELVLINDGSSDLSDIICKKYQTHPKVRYYSNENKGCSYTRNFGIIKAKSQYITFVDSDDYIMPQMYKMMYEKIKSEKLDYLVCGICYYNQENKQMKTVQPKFNKAKWDYLSSEMLLESPVNKIFKRKILLDNNIFFPEDIHSGEDLNFCFKYFLYSKAPGYLNKSLYIYRLHGENSIYKLEKRLDIIKSFDDLYYFLKRENHFLEKQVRKKFYEYFFKCCIWIPLIFFKKRKLKKKSEVLQKLRKEILYKEYIRKKDKILYILLERILWPI